MIAMSIYYTKRRPTALTDHSLSLARVVQPLAGHRSNPPRSQARTRTHLT